MTAIGATCPFAMGLAKVRSPPVSLVGSFVANGRFWLRSGTVQARSSRLFPTPANSPVFHGRRNNSLPSRSYRDVLDCYDLLATVSQPVEGQDPLTVAVHHSRKCVRQTCGLDARYLLPCFPVPGSNIAKQIVRFGGELHREAVRDRNLMSQHLLQGIASLGCLDRVDGEIERAGVGYQLEASDACPRVDQIRLVSHRIDEVQSFTRGLADRHQLAAGPDLG